MNETDEDPVHDQRKIRERNMGYETRFRHELKFEVDRGQYLVIRQRLRAVCEPDPHTTEDGTYLIRSIYFDNINNKALYEKITGVSAREKFRIRYYNDSLDYIRSPFMSR